MNTVVGVFTSRADAERATHNLESIGVADRNISVLAPGAGDKELYTTPTTDAEQPGMGPAVGGVVGGAFGVAGGIDLGAAAASVLIPGVGPVLATGLFGAVNQQNCQSSEDL